MISWNHLSNQRVILRLKFNAGVQSVKGTCHVPVDKHRSMCNAPACRLRSPLARRRRDVGSGKQEEPYSCASAVAVVSTQASALAFSGGKLSGAVDFTRLPDSDADTPDRTWEKAAVHSRGFWVSCGVICRVGRWGAKCDVFHGVLFWQTLGLWLPGQLTGFSTLASTDVIPVRSPTKRYIITFSPPLFNPSWLCHDCSLWRTMVSALRCFILVFDGAQLLTVSVASRFKFEQKNPKNSLVCLKLDTYWRDAYYTDLQGPLEVLHFRLVDVWEWEKRVGGAARHLYRRWQVMDNILLSQEIHPVFVCATSCHK